ncbi:MAG: galactokinase [Bacteroidaceae bacterium]|nr:galactokinase [Bacteroidaceae bacterium]
MVTIEHVRSRFVKHFDGRLGNIYAAPGRINIIGEHTDYNNGFVLPGAVAYGIMCEIRPNGTNTVQLYSIDFKDRVEFSIDSKEGPKASWARYIFGVMRELQKKGLDIKGFNAAFSGDVPPGAGMSSSAALESCFGFALNDLFGEGKGITSWDLALIGQTTEHDYLGMNCGIMDQFASVFGQKGKVMKLDCRSREFEYIPFETNDYTLLMCNSGVKHSFASEEGNAYNERRNSCETVSKILGVETLRDADFNMLAAKKDEINPIDYKRAVYVLGEKERVIAVCDALKAGDFETVGKKMYETHEGLSKDYEVSCEEIDFLVDIARKNNVTGCRIMGGGFGGCTINLVKNEYVKAFAENAKAEYKKTFQRELLVFEAKIGDGARKIE